MINQQICWGSIEGDNWGYWHSFPHVADLRPMGLYYVIISHVKIWELGKLIRDLYSCQVATSSCSLLIV